MHLVTHGHFQSYDKDGGHTIRSTVAEKSMLHANLMALCFIELELWPVKVLHCGKMDFQPFLLPVTLDHEPVTFIYELDPYSLEL